MFDDLAASHKAARQAFHNTIDECIEKTCKDEAEACNDEPRVTECMVPDRYTRASSSSAAASSSHVPMQVPTWWGKQAPQCDHPRARSQKRRRIASVPDSSPFPKAPPFTPCGEMLGGKSPGYTPCGDDDDDVDEMPPPSQHDSEEYQPFTPSGETRASAEVPDMEQIVYRGFKVAGDAQRSVKSSRSAKSKAQPIGASVPITWRIPHPPQPITPQSRTPAGHGWNRVNGVRIPRRRGGQHNWWHTGRIRARDHSRPAETAFLAQYTDKTTFGLRDLHRLHDPAEMEKLHKLGEAMTFLDRRTGRVCTVTY